jgi:hypothetical protein
MAGGKDDNKLAELRDRNDRSSKKNNEATVSNETNSGRLLGNTLSLRPHRTFYLLKMNPGARIKCARYFY